MTQTWDEMLARRERMRQLLKKHGLDAPSRKSVSYNWAERHMRRAFGGRRIPAWAEESPKGVSAK